MALRGCAAGLCLVLVQTAFAAEPPKKLKLPAATAAKQSAVTGRKQIEAKLQMPAKLNFADRKRVTVREVLDQLHQQHQLSLRFDTPTLTAMMDMSSRSPGGCSLAIGGAYYPPQTTGIFPGARGTGISPATYVMPSGTFGAVPPLVAGASYPVASPGVGSLNAPAHAVASVDQVAAGGEDESDPSPAKSPPANVPGRASLPEGSKEAKRRRILDALDAMRRGSAPEGSKEAEAKPPAIGSTGVVNVNSPEGLIETESKLPAAHAEEAPPAKPTDIQEMLTELLESEIDVQTLDLSRVSIATVLRQALDTAPIASENQNSGLPILFTNAMLLDYLVEDDGLLITTRMKALTTKETRVYSIKDLSDLPPEQLAKTIRQSIRPWSWRSQINDLGEQLKGSPLPTETLTSIIKSGIQLTGAEISVTPTEEGSSEPKKMSVLEESRQMEMLGNALSNGLVTLAQSTLLAVEMVHYAEPPTGTIQTLGSKLIITQSQAAHREIADLLKQLAEE